MNDPNVEADLSKLDAVVHELGIEDSFDEPVDCIRALKARAEAAEARCARLEKAATALLSYYENSLNAGPGPRPRTEAALLHDLRAALSDTAQQETGDGRRAGHSKLIYDKAKRTIVTVSDRPHPAADMRERAVKAVDQMSLGPETRGAVIRVLRALPLNSDQEGE